ncbi:hypothetical protein SAMN06265365_121104 [Tistlia consotensis]|uniref:YecR-like lipoprotein n=1 Tax=Tistlia consotensis USBA 355 TaxID=560819 RepID=A0A1Y6CKS4_9PROT|nr:hypothetical protein [Tistlia consotensis]SMF60135.1 hypothetical protein SAMN05428998_12319 [Tistlia consotensis USBA 355]SNR93818.1 hypothetical protein SAMN06265365_121104 [Tistlia consotensis]
MDRFTALFVTGILLTGCVAAWGSSYDVSFQSPESVVIKYDDHFTSTDSVAKVAQASCADYGRRAVAQPESTSFWGITTAPFRCVEG